MNTSKDVAWTATRGQTGTSTLAEGIHERIRERILTWQFLANQVLVEGDLALEFNVSRTPVREALLRLRYEGLIDVLPRVGYQVTPITVEDVEEVFDLRLLLEGEAAALATDRGTDDELRSLADNDRATARELRKTSPDQRAYTQFHDSFHLEIARLAKNGRLAEFISALLRDGTRIRMTDPRMGIHGLEEEQQLNEQLVNVMLARDPEAARSEMQGHILAGKRRVFSRLGETIVVEKPQVRRMDK